MNKKWVLFACFCLLVVAISLMIPKSEPVHENTEDIKEIKFRSYNEEIKNYSIYSIAVYDERKHMLSERLMHLTSEEEIKEFVNHLLSLKVTTEVNVEQEEMVYFIKLNPIRKENNITYIDDYYFSISKNRIYDTPIGRDHLIDDKDILYIKGKNTLYDYIQSKINE